MIFNFRSAHQHPHRSRSAQTELRQIFRIAFAIVLIGFGLILSSGCTCSQKIDVTNTITSEIKANIKGLDPIYANDTYSAEVIAQMFDTLYQYHYLKRPLELEPLLAEGMPEVSAEGLTYTIHLKKGVKFHDSEVFPGGKGRELVANDFIYSFKRVADPRAQSDGYWIFDGKIKGLEEWREGVNKGTATYDTPVEGFQAPDKYTLVLKLTRPYSQLQYVLTMAYAAPVPKEAVDKYGKEFLNHPVGTGPFVFESWTRGNKVELVKNPNWHGGTYPTEGEPGDKEKGLLADAGKTLPFADKLIFYEMVEDQPRWLNFMKGNLDSISIPKDNFDSAIDKNGLRKDFADKGVSLYITREQDLTYTAFNMLDPLLGKNLNLRRAFSFAMDIDTLIEKFYNGRAIRAEGPIPPDIDGYDANFKNPWREYNVEKAKEYLAKAGYPGGKGLPAFTYSSISSSTARQMAEFFQQNMAAIGVKINIKTVSWPQFTQETREKKGQIWGVAWLADYPDAENFLQLLYGPNISPGPNGANFQNKDFDKLYEQAARLSPGPERTALYKKMRDIAVEQMPWIPDTHRLGYYLHHSWLKNYKHHSMISNSQKYLRVDLEKKKEVGAKL
jgi:ABC-type transport system substrate-binding protein